MSTKQVNHWCIPSNGGYAMITCEAIVLHQAIDLLEHRVELVGNHWCRTDFLADPPEFAKVVDDFNITLHQVLIPASALTLLQNDFDNWLASYAPFTRVLCSRPDQELIVQIGPKEGYETTQDRPILTCTYAGGCGAGVSFLVDQSCIRIARDGLSNVMRAILKTDSTS